MTYSCEHCCAHRHEAEMVFLGDGWVCATCLPAARLVQAQTLRRERDLADPPIRNPFNERDFYGD